MNGDKIKNAANWFYGKIFKDEPIRPRQEPPAERIPALIRTARSLENGTGNRWQSRESIFLKQAKLLALYEDDFVFQGSVVRYYPTYQSLSDQELRGYFAWRTKLRKGDVRKTSLSFAFLYIYELINQIGVSDPCDGYEKLIAFRDSYGALDDGILPYLNRWLPDYIVYYELDPALLADSSQAKYDRSISVLDSIRDREDGEVMEAIRFLAPKWLSRSRFYGENQADCDVVIPRVFRRICDHYASKTKKTMTEQFFGMRTEYPIRLFDAAVFCDPIKKRNREIAVDERCVYRCKNGLWTVTKHTAPLRPNTKLENILKTVDAVLREEWGYKYPIKYEAETKWLLKIIREEARGLLAEKKKAEAKKITIDYSQLAKIRREAAATQEKLTVEEEMEAEDISPAPPEELPKETPIPGDSQPESPLSGPECRLLRCLLYGGDIGWVQSEGYMLSVLVDSINEKLYETFMDSVLDDTPELIEDYIEDLKEMEKA